MKKLIKKVSTQIDAIEAYCTCSCTCTCSTSTTRYYDFKDMQYLKYDQAEFSY